MKARHLAPLIIAFLSVPLWANNTPFQGGQTPAPPTQLQPPQLAPAPPNILMQSEAVQVYSLPDGRYHAEINYQDKADDTRKYSFEGTQQEIRQQLEQSGLPEDRKQAVMQALEPGTGNLGDLFGKEFPFSDSLFGGKNPFDDPFFKQDPFGSAFFQNNPFNDEFFQKFIQGMSQFQAPLTQPGDPLPPINPPAPAKPAVQPAAKDKVWL
ncbi:hypothetical protein VSS37_18935 [Candidatus Thiothrix sp. Deng01]|uniref:Uncharacterized protein n=1 Tax=Candidatus Thiothrix phosphatis TaxID=3112415 RepID=A0ABU6D324_9GAMM|nr:hypothetical protein [Candidatus Thiothrix sp. Deng01]MEB4593063.1 hypothetical protein [Candidatus Thiothrix sp. Deng01]